MMRKEKASHTPQHEGLSLVGRLILRGPAYGIVVLEGLAVNHAEQLSRQCPRSPFSRAV